MPEMLVKVIDNGRWKSTWAVGKEYQCLYL